VLSIPTDLAEHQLNVDPRVMPVRLKLRWFIHEQNEFIKKQVKMLLDAGQIGECEYLT
jgi:hypothetical protein